MKGYAESFYKSKQWSNLSYYFARKNNFTCQRCGNYGRIVHHKNYINPSNISDQTVTLNEDNLELLCQDCHNKEHLEKHSSTIEGLIFDEQGNLIEVPPIKK